MGSLVDEDGAKLSSLDENNRELPFTEENFPVGSEILYSTQVEKSRRATVVQWGDQVAAFRHTMPGKVLLFAPDVRKEAWVDSAKILKASLVLNPARISKELYVVGSRMIVQAIHKNSLVNRVSVEIVDWLDPNQVLLKKLDGHPFPGTRRWSPELSFDLDHVLVLKNLPSKPVVTGPVKINPLDHPEGSRLRIRISDDPTSRFAFTPIVVSVDVLDWVCTMRDGVPVSVHDQVQIRRIDSIDTIDTTSVIKTDLIEVLEVLEKPSDSSSVVPQEKEEDALQNFHHHLKELKRLGRELGFESVQVTLT